MSTRLRTLVLATGNAHKVGELRHILARVIEDLGIELVGQSEFPHVMPVAETEVSFVGNATLKARSVAQATGLPALADDSGLSVDVLGGAPGIFSARWSGSRAGEGADRAGVDAANLELLLEQLADVPDEHRGAAFQCAAVLVLPDGTHHEAMGQVRGRLLREPRGEGGFGYDPIFVPEGGELTTAQMSPEDKHAISHRGRAFAAMGPILRGAWSALG